MFSGGFFDTKEFTGEQMLLMAKTGNSTPQTYFPFSSLGNRMDEVQNPRPKRPRHP